MDNKGQIIIYNVDENNTKIEVKLIDGNVWLSQDQIVSLYQSSKSNISEHIKCRLSFYIKLIINNIIKINEESPSNNLTIF